MYEAGNTLKKPIFDTSKWIGMEKAERFFNTIDTITNTFKHPILIFNALNGASYCICIIVGLTGIVLYIMGHKGALKYTGGSLIGLTFIKMIEGALSTL